MKELEKRLKSIIEEVESGGNVDDIDEKISDAVDRTEGGIRNHLSALHESGRMDSVVVDTLESEVGRIIEALEDAIRAEV